ncbi:MAG TPA: hypothetical protein VFA15_07065 [Nitrososphaera sp.]|jgi:hypothetical protein|nr:hypothetical protein [Nitrososphaera sp.]
MPASKILVKWRKKLEEATAGLDGLMESVTKNLSMPFLARIPSEM